MSFKISYHDDGKERWQSHEAHAEGDFMVAFHNGGFNVEGLGGTRAEAAASLLAGMQQLLVEVHAAIAQLQADAAPATQAPEAKPVVCIMADAMAEATQAAAKTKQDLPSAAVYVGVTETKNPVLSHSGDVFRITTISGPLKPYRIQTAGDYVTLLDREGREVIIDNRKPGDTPDAALRADLSLARRMAPLVHPGTPPEQVIKLIRATTTLQVLPLPVTSDSGAQA